MVLTPSGATANGCATRDAVEGSPEGAVGGKGGGPSGTLATAEAVGRRGGGGETANGREVSRSNPEATATGAAASVGSDLAKLVRDTGPAGAGGTCPGGAWRQADFCGHLLAPCVVAPQRWHVCLNWQLATVHFPFWKRKQMRSPAPSVAGPLEAALARPRPPPLAPGLFAVFLTGGAREPDASSGRDCRPRLAMAAPADIVIGVSKCWRRVRSHETAIARAWASVEPSSTARKARRRSWNS